MAPHADDGKLFKFSHLSHFGLSGSFCSPVSMLLPCPLFSPFPALPMGPWAAFHGLGSEFNILNAEKPYIWIEGPLQSPPTLRNIP